MDDVETQKRFAQSLNLPFPLAADPKGEAVEAYGVRNGARASRTTFIVDSDGKVVKVLEGQDAFDPAAAADACPIHNGKKS